MGTSTDINYYSEGIYEPMDAGKHWGGRVGRERFMRRVSDETDARAWWELSTWRVRCLVIVLVGRRLFPPPERSAPSSRNTHTPPLFPTSNVSNDSWQRTRNQSHSSLPDTHDPSPTSRSLLFRMTEHTSSSPVARMAILCCANGLVIG